MLLSSYSDEPVNGCDDSAGEIEALRGAGEGESERCEVEHEESERVGEDEGEKVVRSLRRGLAGESLRKDGILGVCVWECGRPMTWWYSVVVSWVYLRSKPVSRYADGLSSNECRS